ncbi:nucleic acid-binding, OB-fold protein [Tanacetum coccineum]
MITTFDMLPGQEAEFPNHHFKFISYNQLPPRVPHQDENSKMVYLVLTDYLGHIRSISDMSHFRDVSRNQSYRKKIDIENLNQCTKKVTKQNGEYDCKDHGQQDPPTHRYNFKASATNGTANVQFTFFTASQGQTIEGPGGIAKIIAGTDRPPATEGSTSTGKNIPAFGKHWKEKHMAWARFGKRQDKNATLQDFDGALDLQCVETAS